MQRLIITCVLILFFVSPCFCKRLLLETSNTYNVIDYGAKGDGETDDSQAFLSAWEKTCATSGSTLVIPSKGTFLLKKNIMFKGPCQATNIQIQIQGKIIVPTQDAWQGDDSPIIMISNVNGLTIDGTGGLIDGLGSSWWSCKNCKRPTVLAFNACNDLSVSSLSIANSPQAHITINGCEGATFSNINIQSPGDSPNTDGIDISSSKRILIKDSNIASGDDCIAIIGDSSNINATGIACGPGHGISIGSLGRNNGHDNVEQVYVYNCTFTKTTNGARIKTFKDGPGYARNITYEKITLIQAYNPILINQHYGVGGVEVSGVTFRGFEGTSGDDRAITLACGSQGCKDIVLDQINITSSKDGKPAACSCTNAHGTATSTVPNCDGL
ncbi:probable polygalacturonase At3g15720 [Vigna unguiculata]|uniref:probable polygalacturonase At3g15720 n=1 Tax=Vigna unguiculata TaxID=3917 RepID=UPI001015E553|nr:probable polygalacturonase At3g15720 [Vigna unguiculata]